MFHYYDMINSVLVYTKKETRHLDIRSKIVLQHLYVWKMANMGTVDWSKAAKIIKCRGAIHIVLYKFDYLVASTVNRAFSSFYTSFLSCIWVTK